MGVINVVGRPSFTIPFFVPVAFLAGRMEMLSMPAAVVVYGSLVGFLAIASFRKPTNSKAGAPPPRLNDPKGGAPDLNSTETTEWLNGVVRNLWLRYPTKIGDIIKEHILEEAILQGLRRDKVLPAGPVKDVRATRVDLKKSSPWVMRGRINEMRSPNEMCVTATIRFVSDDNAGVELEVVLSGGVSIPIRVENISIETELIFRIHLQEKAPFVRVIWISMTEQPNLDLSIIPMGLDIMQVPGLDQILHDLIMTGIKNEIVLPIGKIVPITQNMPPDYYKEWGREGHPVYAKPQNQNDAFEGKVVLFLEETKILMHPQHHEGGAFDLYVRVSLGEQEGRTHKIKNTFHEMVHDRFDFMFKNTASESIILELVCKQDVIQYDPVPLGSILISDLLEGKFRESTWVDVEAITNCKMKVRCQLRTFRDPLTTTSEQFSPTKEVCV
eukprot:CAMPEP_0181288872 /NCGR_PEP_ID=MMETSP1101-20121128/574_1 /TAXON_ID=46948 /ORGANISM="Rhodomonas abbreviata, Strain Caron Lab Isolate" /LENGTH=441 /DNA_ID=CAMNT_0023393043 /DNA_START=1 /DNA_END=1323 /DNA_ORIENTATION=+